MCVIVFWLVVCIDFLMVCVRDCFCIHAAAAAAAPVTPEVHIEGIK